VVAAVVVVVVVVVVVAAAAVYHSQGWKKPRFFLEKVFRFLGFLRFFRF